MVVDVVCWVIIGVLIGWNAPRLVEQSSYTGRGPQGDFGFALLGALLGGIFARLLGVGGHAAGDNFTWLTLIVAAIGATIALGLARATAKQTAR